MLSKIKVFFVGIWHIFYDWGISEEEKQIHYPCDDASDLPATILYRGMSIHASVEKVFPWLCQMRIAPYSYDWLDNLGRKSPRQLFEGITNLENGQVFMTGFTLVSYESNRHVTIRSRHELPVWMFFFGDIVLTYLLEPVSSSECRLLVKMRLGFPRGVVMRLIMKFILPPGDTFMMHKQLRTFKTLAETAV